MPEVERLVAFVAAGRLVGDAALPLGFALVAADGLGVLAVRAVFAVLADFAADGRAVTTRT